MKPFRGYIPVKIYNLNMIDENVVFKHKRTKYRLIHQMKLAN